MSDTDSQTPEPQGGGDQYAKTLALLRRLLVGNGYKLEEIQITQVENKDFVLPGKLALELEIGQKMEKLRGPARGGETRVFRDRPEEQSYLASLRDQFASEHWIDEVRTLVEKSPGQGWAMKDARWPLPKLSQRVALQMICDLCLGKRVENCLTCHGQREIMCQTCNGAGMQNCQACYGSGADQADRSRPCPRCMGRRQQPCITCQGRQRIQCHTCRGSGQTECRECQGLGFMTEETTITASAHGSFVVGGLSGAPLSVDQLVDRLGPEGIARGHALIMPDAQANAESTENAIFYVATLPYGRFKLKLDNQEHDVQAVGMKPVLVEFPTLLDDKLQPALEQLSSVSLMSLAKKYRLIRELSEALARGVKPAAFFTQRYPYGLSAPFAFELAGRLKEVFSGVSLVPRVIAGLIGLGASLGVYFVWLTNPRPELLPSAVPVALWDGALLLMLAVASWTVIGTLGKNMLQKLMPVPTKLAAAGGMVAHGFALAIVLGGLALLYLPFSRPEWVAALLR